MTAPRFPEPTAAPLQGSDGAWRRLRAAGVDYCAAASATELYEAVAKFDTLCADGKQLADDFLRVWLGEWAAARRARLGRRRHSRAVLRNRRLGQQALQWLERHRRDVRGYGGDDGERCVECCDIPLQPGEIPCKGSYLDPGTHPAWRGTGAGPEDHGARPKIVMRAFGGDTQINDEWQMNGDD